MPMSKPRVFICDKCDAFSPKPECEYDNAAASPARMFLFSDGQEYIDVLARDPESATAAARAWAGRYEADDERMLGDIESTIGLLRRVAKLAPLAAARLEAGLAAHREWRTNMPVLTEHELYDEFLQTDVVWSRLKGECSPHVWGNTWNDPDAHFCGDEHCDPPDLADIRRRYVYDKKLVAGLFAELRFNFDTKLHDGLKTMLSWLELAVPRTGVSKEKVKKTTP